MDLPVITPTLKPFEDIKVLHLELTTRCNAQCPQCARMDPTSGYHADHELTLKKVKTLFPIELIQNLDKMFACGNFGDPAAAKECLDIFCWFREVNPKITLGLNTNGGLRDARFWAEMAQVLCNELDYCVFSIDGMSDTNDIYRKNVQWNKVITNAESFIHHGGRAHWDMLVFDYNQSQIDICREYAKQMGFVCFRTKVTSRFQERPVQFLKPPKGYIQPIATGPIKCHALQEKSLYVAATGQILPCCFIGSEVFRIDTRLDQLINDKAALVESWATDPHPVCVKFCSTSDSQTVFAGQFKEETSLC